MRRFLHASVVATAALGCGGGGDGSLDVPGADSGRDATEGADVADAAERDDARGFDADDVSPSDVLDADAAADVSDASADIGTDRSFPLGLGAVSVFAGGDRTCVVGDDVLCWGANTHGEIGAASTPVLHAHPLGLAGVKTLSLGATHTCAIRSDDSLWCWGGNDSGQVGDGTTIDRSTPTAILPDVAKVSCGGAHTCAVMKDGTVRCWGANDQGQLGDGTTTGRTSPTKISLSAVAEVSAGASHTCAIDGADAPHVVRCWGANEHGQLGDGTTTPHSSPIFVSSGFDTIAAGSFLTCASASGVTCWGNDSIAGISNAGALVKLGGTTGTVIPGAMFAGRHHFGALHGAYVVGESWGSNAYGQLGNGSTIDSAAGVEWFVTLAAAHQVAVGADHTCRRMNSGIQCWGKNDQGQVGTGTTSAYELKKSTVN